MTRLILLLVLLYSVIIINGQCSDHSPLSITVNNAMFKSHRYKTDENVYEAFYMFGKDDFVDVMFWDKEDQCESLSIAYEYVDELSDTSHRVQPNDTYFKFTVGFRAKLQFVNYATLSCYCVNKSREYKYTSYLYLRSKDYSENLMTLRINGLVIRPSNFNVDYDICSVVYNMDENIHVNFEKNVETAKEIYLKHKNIKKVDMNTSNSNLDEKNNNIHLQFKLKNDNNGNIAFSDAVECIAKPKSSGYPEILHITFKIYDAFKDYIPLRIQGLNDKNKLMTFYSKISEIIYYQFEDGDSLDIVCKSPLHETVLSPPESKIKFGPNYNNGNITCSIIKQNLTLKEVKVFFFMKNETTPTSTTTMEAITEATTVTTTRATNTTVDINTTILPITELEPTSILTTTTTPPNNFNETTILTSPKNEIAINVIPLNVTTASARMPKKVNNKLKNKKVNGQNKGSKILLSSRSTNSPIKLPIQIDTTTQSPYTPEYNTGQNYMVIIVTVAAVICIVLTCFIVVYRLKTRPNSQGHHDDRTYSNIPNKNRQCGSNTYAIPTSHTEDGTYSVPCKPEDLYAKPITYKNQLCDKNNEVITYANLQSKKNVTNENYENTSDDLHTDIDSTYANLAATNTVKPDLYPKPVLKSKRISKSDKKYKQLENDTTTYAVIHKTNEPNKKSKLKSQNIAKKDEPLIYAELDLKNNPNSTKTSKDINKSIYSEIMRNSEKKNKENSGNNHYGNMFDESKYMNAGNSENLEPTYCELSLKQMNK